MGSGCSLGCSGSHMPAIAIKTVDGHVPSAPSAGTIWMPFMNQQLMELLGSFKTNPPKSSKEFGDLVRDYCKIKGSYGLSKALKKYPEGQVDPEMFFFNKTLPFIVDSAFKLKDRVTKDFPNGIPLLQVNKQSRCKLARPLVTSLLAHMFLCSFDSPVATVANREMPSPVSCKQLLGASNTAEVAKLKMIIHYFERAMDDEPKGYIIIDRVVAKGLSEKAWMKSEKKLLPVDVAKQHAGFEEAPGLAHVDFANKSLGGGVFTGGCVQEEIRFAICPELLCSLLLCPKMEDEEAVQIVGAEQFSAYAGYSYNMTYAGDYRDKTYPRDTDGTPLISILAMDAVDFKHKDNTIKNQMCAKWTVRELNKALAAFTAPDEATREKFPDIATGNWGCGAFKGEPSVKAVIQWAAACECGRKLKYFPFELGWGEILKKFSENISSQGATVGQLMVAYWKVRERIHTYTKKETLFDALQLVMAEDANGGTEAKGTLPT
jgi:poly(ADP-ribose) glycohydrolase